MIKVNRDTVPRPSCLDPENGKGGEERAKAIEHYEAVPPEASFQFKVYRNREIKLALEQLFNGKCAYCESKFSSTHPADVEHYRPKGAVVTVAASGEQETLAGYYWLASTWENLLPSCIDCNRARYHPIFVPGENRVITSLSGKENLFPIHREETRWTEHSQENREVALLLNPCDVSEEIEGAGTNDPEKILAFDEDAGVIPDANLSEIELLRYRESARVYGLNRLGLVQERREIMYRIRERQFVIRKLSELYDRCNADEDEEKAAMVGDLISHEMASMYRYTRQSSPYSLMAKKLINSFVKTLTEP